MADYILSVTGAELENRLVRPLPVNQGGTGSTSAKTAPEVTYDASVASGHSISVRYYPYLTACFCRGYVTVSGVAVTAGSWVTVATVDASVVPSASYPTPLATNIATGGEARITASGELQFRFYTDMPESATRYVYFSGWWTTSN